MKRFTLYAADDHRLNKRSVETAVGLQASECNVDAGVVNLGKIFRILLDPKFFPVTADVESAQEVVEDRVVAQFECRISVARAQFRGDRWSGWKAYSDAIEQQPQDQNGNLQNECSFIAAYAKLVMSADKGGMRDQSLLDD